jgi:hypothetical protein
VTTDEGWEHGPTHQLADIEERTLWSELLGHLVDLNGRRVSVSAGQVVVTGVRVEKTVLLERGGHQWAVVHLGENVRVRARIVHQRGYAGQRVVRRALDAAHLSAAGVSTTPGGPVCLHTRNPSHPAVVNVCLQRSDARPCGYGEGGGVDHHAPQAEGWCGGDAAARVAGAAAGELDCKSAC